MIMKEIYQNQCQFPPSTISTDISSLSCEIRLISSPQDQGATHGEYHLSPHHHQQQHEKNDLLSVVLDQTNDNCNQRVGEEHAQGSAKWMSSKMRLMRKMLGTDQILVNKLRRSQFLQDQASISGSNNSPTDIIRTCSNCKTTKTPLWRSGPQGPKSLCNACGIRQMKARRAMRAVAGLTVTNCKMQHEERRADVDHSIPFKKRFKIVTSASAQKKLRLDDMAISLSKKSAFSQTFPQEEKDAAILLMALSCGLIHS